MKVKADKNYSVDFSKMMKILEQLKPKMKKYIYIM